MMAGDDDDDDGSKHGMLPSQARAQDGAVATTVDSHAKEGNQNELIE